MLIYIYTQYVIYVCILIYDDICNIWWYMMIYDDICYICWYMLMYIQIDICWYRLITRLCDSKCMEMPSETCYSPLHVIVTLISMSWNLYMFHGFGLIRFLQNQVWCVDVSSPPGSICSRTAAVINSLDCKRSW